MKRGSLGLGEVKGLCKKKLLKRFQEVNEKGPLGSHADTGRMVLQRSRASHWFQFKSPNLQEKVEERVPILFTTHKNQLYVCVGSGFAE